MKKKNRDYIVRQIKKRIKDIKNTIRRYNMFIEGSKKDIRKYNRGINASEKNLACFRNLLEDILKVR